MALAECHKRINRKTPQLCNVKDCEVKFPTSAFPLHHYLPVMATMRGGKDGSPDWEDRGKISGSESKKHKAHFQTEISHSEQTAFWGPYILQGRETWRSSAVEEFSSHHPSLTCKPPPQFSSNHVSIGLSSESSCGISLCHFPHDLGFLGPPFKVQKDKESQKYMSPQNWV